MEDHASLPQRLLLRPMQSGDLDYFLQLGCETCGSLHGRPSQTKTDLFERFRGFVKEFAFRPESEIWIASTETVHYAGHLWLYVSTNRFNGIKELWVWDVSVAPGCRRQGIGRKLMEHARQRAVEQNCAELWLLVAENNPSAQALYASSGLSARGRMMAVAL